MRSLISYTVVLGLIFLVCFPLSGESLSLTLEESYFEIDNDWAKVERWRDDSPLFAPEDYPQDGRGNQDGQRLTFFNQVLQPDSNTFLLYYGTNYETNSETVPVLLVHGANDNADRAWANPNDLGSYGCGSITCPATGLMQYLDSRGYKVFALSFPHKQGDNYYWAEQIADAIAIVKNVTGQNQVDVIGWSKGAFASRMYASSVKKVQGTSYANDIRKLILIGNPNEGFDYIFRHGWFHNFSIFPEAGGSVNAPAPHSKMMLYGIWVEHPELSIYDTPAGNYFPGQRQMLSKWINNYPLPIYEQDWYTTYHGGWGFYTYGKGIDQAISEGSLVQTIISAGIPAAIETYLLSGCYNIIPGIHYEHTGPSDGVVFIDSAASVSGIGQVAGNVTLNLNHLQLGWHSDSCKQIHLWLQE